MTNLINIKMLFAQKLKSGNGLAIQFEQENLFTCPLYTFSKKAVQLTTVKCFEL
jgi:hypothetical protein